MDECLDPTFHNCESNDFCVNTQTEVGFYCCKNNTVNVNNGCVGCFTEYDAQVKKLRNSEKPKLKKLKTNKKEEFHC